MYHNENAFHKQFVTKFSDPLHIQNADFIAAWYKLYLCGYALYVSLPLRSAISRTVECIEDIQIAYPYKYLINQDYNKIYVPYI